MKHGRFFTSLSCPASENQVMHMTTADIQELFFIQMRDLTFRTTRPQLTRFLDFFR